MVMTVTARDFGARLDRGCLGHRLGGAVACPLEVSIAGDVEGAVRQGELLHRLWVSCEDVLAPSDGLCGTRMLAGPLKRIGYMLSDSD